MRNLLDDAPARSIDIIANEDTIEMVLNESAMQALSQAAAPTEPPRPPEPSPVLKESDVPAAAAPAISQERRADQFPEHPAAHPPERLTDHSPEGRGNPPERGADNSLKGGAEHSPARGADRSAERRANPLERRAENPSERRPPMSSLRFAILVGVVAVGSAIGTAVTYLVTTGALRPGHVATSMVSEAPAAPVASIAPAASAALVAAPAVVTPTASVATAAPATPTAPAPVTPVAPAATTAPPASPPVQPGPQPSSPSSASASASAPSPAPDSAPVRFVNPFDHKEVFEFPAGTSKADARDAVAELLYERAQDRVLSARGLVPGMGARHTTSASTSAAPAGRKAQP
jgi:hypothetical protein